MSKLIASLMIGAGALITPCAPAAAIVLGPHAAACEAAGKPAMLVKVMGLKARTGLIRVQTYGGDPAHYFDKGTYIERVEVPTPTAGTVEICMPVPHNGTYAISVRHDVSGHGGSTDLTDGGGMSGNPNISLMDVVFKRRPSPVQVQVRVENGVTPVPIVMNYVRGGGFGPIAGAR
jgi:uncharacterized protein (DUF2141 family)